MRKFPLALVISFLLMALAACSINSQSADEKNVIIFTVDLSGYEQRGYAVGTRNLHVWVRNFFSTNYEMIDTSMSAQVDSATGKYSLTGAVLKDTIVEIQSGADDYIDIAGHRLMYDMDLVSLANVKERKTINANYLTTLASELVKHNLRHRHSFAEAKTMANTAVLKALQLPTENVDFETYSIYGEGEGDAMLIAVSILVEMFHLEYSMRTDWLPLDIDTLTEQFKYPEVYSRLVNLAERLLWEGSVDSVRKAIESRSPNGKVGPFEKYLSIFFANGRGGHKCDASTQGVLIETGQGYYYHHLICSDSAWRVPRRDDYDIKYQFNPDVEYGTLTDTRDGRTYRTVKMGSAVWMAENLKYADSAATPNLKGQNWCYDNDEVNCEIFGRLYSWTAAMDIPTVYLDSVYISSERPLGQGICPDGWHVPDSHDMYILPKEESFLSAYMTNSRNESGFSFLVGGYAYPRSEYGEDGETVYTNEMDFKYMGTKGYMWTSGMESYGSARVEYFAISEDYSGHSQLNNSPSTRRAGAYVRCVMDVDDE